MSIHVFLLFNFVRNILCVTGLPVVADYGHKVAV